MLGRQKSEVWLRGANIETGGGGGGGGRVEKIYQEIVYYNRMHVKTRLSQSILSKIVYFVAYPTRTIIATSFLGKSNWSIDQIY